LLVQQSNQETTRAFAGTIEGISLAATTMERMMRAIFGILLLPGLLLAPRAVAAQTWAPSPALSPDFSAATALLEQYVADGKIAGAVAAVARNGHLLYLQPVGVQSVESGTAMSEESLFRIYSMTKAVTSVAVMMLHEEGHFQLSDPVSKYLPIFSQVKVAVEGGTPREPVRPITVQDLLLHTSGLNHRTSAVYREARVRNRADTMEEFLQKIVAVPLMEDPGTRYRYSEGTTVLGALVEVWSGKPFDVFLQERILTPLGMTETVFQVRPEQLERLTVVHQTVDGRLMPTELEEVPFTEKASLLEGAVGLVSTAPDYLRFSQMLLNGGELDGRRFLRPESVAAMTRNGLSPEVQALRGGVMGWSLGNVNVLLEDGATNPPSNAGEYGWDGSAGTIFWNDPEEQTVIILLTQSVPANPDSLRQRFKTLVKEALK
jgi:CubicO group peptidase (beta-lactamase class C family)